MYTKKVAAIVVLYMPNFDLLDRLLGSLDGEVDKVFVIDNTPTKELGDFSASWFESKGHLVTYAPLGDNVGIAKAQNIGIDLAMQEGFSHVILFDQDSAIPTGMVNVLLDAERELNQKNIRVGSVGPLFLDEKTNEYSKAIKHGFFLVKKIAVIPMDDLPVKADYLIASGSLIKISALKEIGLMREDLFIDWVDIEWGLRASKLKFEHFIIPRAIMRHSIGDEFIEVGKKKINLHSDIRNYYIVRNACYLLLSSDVDYRWRLNIFWKIPFYVVFYTFTSKQRFSAFKVLLRACVDGFTGRLGKAF